jgi:hypothetical protein
MPDVTAVQDATWIEKARSLASLLVALSPAERGLVAAGGGGGLEPLRRPVAGAPVGGASGCGRSRDPSP